MHMTKNVSFASDDEDEVAAARSSTEDANDQRTPVETPRDLKMMKKFGMDLQNAILARVIVSRRQKELRQVGSPPGLALFGPVAWHSSNPAA